MRTQKTKSLLTKDEIESYLLSEEEYKEYLKSLFDPFAVLKKFRKLHKSKILLLF